MSKKLIALVLLISTLVFMQCKKGKKKISVKQTETAMKKKHNLVGGWSAIEATDFVTDLGQYVLSEKQIESPINAITNSAIQVVSGKNYRFNMSLENGDKYLTQVYINIKGEKEITTFKKIE